ncbi:MAG: radical SAM protein [Candidatus Omnitrophota bacterium]
MNYKYLCSLLRTNFLFWLSRKINYPLVPPDLVQINFTFDCNLRCKMCSMHDQLDFLKKQGKRVEIDSQAMRKIIKETRDLGTRTVLFIGGEPLLKNDLFELITFTKSLGLSPIIVTNGVMLDKDNIGKCFESGLEWLSISIDAASEATFAKVRGEKVFGRITENLRLLNSMKDEKRIEFPKVVSVCTIMDDNIEELMDVVELCRELRIERVIFQPVVANNIDQTQRDGVFPGFIPEDRLKIMDEAIDRLIRYKRSSPENFSFIANSVRMLNLLKKYFRGKMKPKDLPCYAGYNRLQVVQEGKVYFCVDQNKYVANFGDIDKDTLKNLWYSPKASFYRKLIRRCASPCLQWCSYRDSFTEVSDLFWKKILFKK